MNHISTLNKLEWPVLTKHLAGYCHTKEGFERCEGLTPHKTREEVHAHWRLLVPLRDLIDQGITVPLSEVEPIETLLKAAHIGQILDAKDFLVFSSLLNTVYLLTQFIKEYAPRCSTLNLFTPLLVPLPHVLKDIKKTIDVDGKIKDDASSDLGKIRNQKRFLKQRIEQKLNQVISSDNTYIQDHFFTTRLDKYVVPVSLDGRGRFPGHIVDTSASGQTLFMEPASVAPMNHELQELDLSEKLEIVRILKRLTVEIAQQEDTLRTNYEQMIVMDVLAAQASFAAHIGGNAVTLRDTPGFELFSARHPLLAVAKHKPVVSNHVALNEGQRSLIISGPNAGGKTVVLKTMGLLQLMAKAGLLIPVAEHSSLFLYAHIFVEMGDSQDLSANLSTFSGHLWGLKNLLNQATALDLVLLDELAAGTEPYAGAALAQGIIEYLAQHSITHIVTTHFDNLKLLALEHSMYRNGSMEYKETTYQPTYRLVLDVPGQSYGLEVATQMQLPISILQRAQVLRGAQSKSLDDAIKKLSDAHVDLNLLKQDTKSALLEAQSQKVRWEQEVSLLAKKRESIGRELKERYQTHMESLKSELQNLQKSIIHQTHDNEAVLSLQQKATDAQKQLVELSQELKTLAEAPPQPIPGIICQFHQLKVGQKVYVIHLRKEGVISRWSGPKDDIEVVLGMMKTKVPLHGLRLLRQDQPPVKGQPRNGHKTTERSTGGQAFSSPLSSLNTHRADLRGMSSEQALEYMWKAIDVAVMSGNDYVVLVHGHGTSALKYTIREALSKKDLNYEIRFRSGQLGEGGDGVTIVTIA